VPISLIGLLGDKDVLVGAVDVATDRVETPEEVAAVIRSAMQHVPAARIFPCHQLRDGAAPRAAWRATSCGRSARGPPSCGASSPADPQPMTQEMTAYYARRAAEYERVYTPARAGRTTWPGCARV